MKLEDVDDAEAASLFYYHESEDAMEYMSSSSIDTEGYVAFPFTHASDYVILMGDTALAAWPQAAEADSMDVSADASDAGADAMKWPVKNLRIGLIVAVAVVLQPRSFTRERDKKDKNRKDSRRSRSLTGLSVLWYHGGSEYTAKMK